MKKIDFKDGLYALSDKLANNGVFLTVGGEKPNTMTIGWASAGVIWGKPILTVLVRPQRHTYSLIENAEYFTVSIPTKNPLKDELRFAGTASGRDLDKFDGHGLTAVPALTANAPIIGECGLHYECRIVHRQPLTEGISDKDEYTRMYPLKDYHVMYYGEIIEAYTTDE